MSNYIERGWETNPALRGERFDNEPSPWSKEGRKIALRNRQAIVDAYELANRAALQELANELNHRLGESQALRREENLHNLYDRQERAMDECSRRGRGNPNREAVHMRAFNAWDNTEISILQRGHNGSMGR